MEQPELEKFRTQLLDLKRELQVMAEASRDSTRPVILDQASVGRLSRMDAMQGQEMAQEVARRRQLQLARIDGALRRIDAGDFGYCFNCGAEIDKRRLSLDPTNARCLACAEKSRIQGT